MRLLTKFCGEDDAMLFENVMLCNDKNDFLASATFATTAITKPAF
jgi:hypothetical protein